MTSKIISQSLKIMPTIFCSLQVPHIIIVIFYQHITHDNSLISIMRKCLYFCPPTWLLYNLLKMNVKNLNYDKKLSSHSCMYPNEICYIEWWTKERPLADFWFRNKTFFKLHIVPPYKFKMCQAAYEINHKRMEIQILVKIMIWQHLS